MNETTSPAPSDAPLTDVQLARRIAEKVGELLLILQGSGLFEGKALGKAGDRLANAFIMEALKTHRPDDAVLSEEEKDSAARLSASRVWIVDPLDGTREYGEGRTDWAVHVALSIDGKPGPSAVALPGQGVTLCTGTKPAPTQPPRKLRMTISRSRPAAEAVAVAEALDAELVPMGSAGAKAMAVVQGDADIYLHTGGQYEWDNCAPAAVAKAAGLHVSRADGSPLAYNAENPYLPDLLICSPHLVQQVLEALSKFKSDNRAQ
ncbi:3'(2'),5'-bisphosphate nucleotidase CysQ [Sphingomonas sp. CGMCC 1.13654]|uniref:3'(2'),5'-bisphosphate nucleotidase CysQ n=1 Tax=Sphingomonas chungangi TaxID=2683589 RepID=A0A838L170_9SPHN|nr:3'(2'),5'-bisphosphate nucleotidase CysQ [Sphingomonas chungangi]MBA2932690.1 3'(2'),5'-bisphosphate nucleotidase CysQ [Sphingomonas chungangi]MVW56312.1 3'(2'),5'-bisphosphate nucleotidase CysQ [Sphingomonas chungangi]